MSATDGSTVGWQDVLARYRAALEAHRIVLTTTTAGDEKVTPEPPLRFVPPAGLPPMPAELRGEAMCLDAETAELLTHARELLAGMHPPATTPVHRSVLAPPSPSQMDTRL